jgi:hypothetical protein
MSIRPPRPGVRLTTARPLALLGAAALAAGTAAAPAPNAATAALPAVSLLQVPLSFSLQPLFAEMERQVPLQAGNWPRWQRRLGIETRYRGWRGKLAAGLSGDILRVQAHVRYQVQARARLAGLALDTSCGVDEPPRQALIGLQARLGWGADWGLRPQFRLLPTRFLDRCELTAADIDVTPLVEQAFQARMRDSLDRAMEALTPELARLRSRAQTLWTRLNRPIPVADGGWILLHPVGVALSPLSGRGTRGSLQLVVALRPQLRLGPPPPLAVPPLPPLQQAYPGSPGLRFRLGLRLDYAALGQHLAEALRGRELEVKGHRFDIRSVTLSGKGRELHAALDLGGKAAGRAELWAEAGFDPTEQTLRLKTLDYVLHPDDPDVYGMSLMFYQQIRDALLDAANGLLRRQLELARTRLRQALAELLPEGLDADLGTLRLERLDIELDPDGMRLDGEAGGSATLTAGP